MVAESSGKVLFVTFDVIPDPTGSSAHTSELLKGLSAFHEVEVLSAKTPEHGHIERYQGARLLRVPVGNGDLKSRSEAFARAIRRQLQSEEYDLVHFTDPYGGYPICELGSSLGYKLVYEARAFPSIEIKYLEPDLETDRAFITRLRRQEIFCLSNADHVFVPSEVTRSMVAGLGVAEDKLELLPPLVDLAPLATLPPPDAEQCRVLYLGSQASWQGLPSLLFALRMAVKREEMKVRIIGPAQGSWQRQLQEMIREFGLRDFVTIELAVPHEDVSHLLASTDVCVAPLQKGDRNQEQGASPMKIAEAMAAGRVVVAADLPMTRELIEENVTGLLYPPSDEGALGDLLVRIARDPQRRTKIGEAARASAARYDAKQLRARVAQVYAELLHPRVDVSLEAFVVNLDGAQQAEREEATQPKADQGEGPTSMADLNEIQQKQQVRSQEPEAPGDIATGEAPSPESLASASSQSGGAAASEATPNPEPSNPMQTTGVSGGQALSQSEDRTAPLAGSAEPATPEDETTGPKVTPAAPSSSPTLLPNLEDPTGPRFVQTQPRHAEEQATGIKVNPSQPYETADEATGPKFVPDSAFDFVEETTGPKPFPAPPDSPAEAVAPEGLEATASVPERAQVAAQDSVPGEAQEQAQEAAENSLDASSAAPEAASIRHERSVEEASLPAPSVGEVADP